MNNSPINDLRHVVENEGFGYVIIDVADHLAGKAFDIAKSIAARVFPAEKNN
ncbi:MAG: hypothetical protein UT33_C0012G0057 [Candidatus Peregrinibacteria bacterium GW2011_GWC2_39_14]|nr:MAG: hypothetical protein US92_C0003G0084 [Candidatus Peregrinibacteria bacterium GW2011_GWA2_38_36]KKR05252.1 MAG: hypothetical protein UT33_C0012G0057 [Candidatus Peregrinibacteria bacterium GW2011_GWC2_39_14]